MHVGIFRSARCRGIAKAVTEVTAALLRSLFDLPSWNRWTHVRPAACRIRSVISCGREMSDKWLAFTSIVVAPMRLAMNR